MRLWGGLALVGLFLLGLGLRLGGLLFNGQLDLDEIMFVWGAEVHAYGLAAAFKVNYGLFSYALYGLFFSLAESMPRFWWVPYKLGEIIFEVGIFLGLYRLLPPRLKWAAFPTFWLNPWFILHGAWQGFWEGPHVWLALLAVIWMDRLRDERLAWFVAGVCLMSAAMFKPQGLAYFVVPVGFYLGIQLLRYRHSGVVWFSAAIGLVVVAGTAWIVAHGGRVTAILANYFGAVRVMPNLCNGCVSGWRTVAVLLQWRLSQPGPTYTLHLPPWLDQPLHGLAALATLVLLLVMAFRLPLLPQHPLSFRPLVWLQTKLARWNVVTTSVVTGARTTEVVTTDAGTLLLVLALASLIVSQIGTRAHINHTYTALVLLIPLVVGQSRTLLAWVIMVAIEFYAHLATYQLGRSVVLPEFMRDPRPPLPLIAGINDALALQPYPMLLHYQARVNDFIVGHLPIEPVIAILSFIHFACTLYLLYRLLGRPHILVT